MLGNTSDMKAQELLHRMDTMGHNHTESIKKKNPFKNHNHTFLLRHRCVSSLMVHPRQVSAHPSAAQIRQTTYQE